MSTRGKIIRGAGGHLKRNTDLGVGIGAPHGGDEGDIRVRMVDSSPHLYARAGGEWYGINLASRKSEELRLGDDSNYINVKRGDIEMTGKISLISSATQNVCIGVKNSNKGTDNIVIGDRAGQEIVSGTNNVLMGIGAGQYLTDADFNICIGAVCGLYLNKSGTDGYQNVYLGFGAGRGPLAGNTGNYNVGIGYHALRNNIDGDDNVAVGRYALYDLEDGLRNTGVGYGAGQNIIGAGAANGLNNACLGYNSGATITTGANNTCIGHTADVSAVGASMQFAIGVGADAPGNNQGSIGGATVTDIYMADDKGAKVWCTNIDSSSDARIKKNIQKTTLGLDFINKLNPVTFNMRKIDEWDEDLKKKQPWVVNAEKWTRKEKTPRDIDDTELKIGFIAQEVKAALGDVDCDLHTECENDCIEALDYTRFVAPLAKAIQELSAKIDTMQVEINNLT